MGPGAPLSEANAVGVDHPVTAHDVERIGTFYRERDCAPRAIVSPVSNPDFAPLLARAGFVPVKYENTLVAELERLEGERDDRIREAADPAAWSDASARGFSDSADPPDDLKMASLLLATGGAVALEARDGDRSVDGSGR